MIPYLGHRSAQKVPFLGHRFLHRASCGTMRRGEPAGQLQPWRPHMPSTDATTTTHFVPRNCPGVSPHASTPKQQWPHPLGTRRTFLMQGFVEQRTVATSGLVSGSTDALSPRTTHLRFRTSTPTNKSMSGHGILLSLTIISTKKKERS